MNNTIDLTPYLPSQACVCRRKRREKAVRCVSETIESILSLCIGAGFFVMLVAFFTAMM